MSYLSSHTLRVDRDDTSFFYDQRSERLPEIESYLHSGEVDRLQRSIEGRTYIVLGGDGLFVAVAKEAHRDNAQILGINYGTKGFLLHDRDALSSDPLEFERVEYPILHGDIHIGDEEIHSHAFNEIYITRAGDASSLRLSLAHRGKMLESYVGDGLMVSTPAGSTGWSRSYGGIVLPHDANLNIITPLGKMSPRDLQPFVVSDKGRIRIKNDPTRTNPLDILVDNRRIVSMESRALDITIERAERGVILLIERSYREEWDEKPYRELGFGGKEHTLHL